MSILIKGIKKMSECDYQPVILDWVEGAVWNITRTTKIAEMQIIPTPHGRLIDADALLKRTATTVDITAVTGNEDDKEFCNKFWQGFSLFVNKEPAIIEAED